MFGVVRAAQQGIGIAIAPLPNYESAKLNTRDHHENEIEGVIELSQMEEE